MYKQMTIFDLLGDEKEPVGEKKEPKSVKDGDYVEDHGMVICHIMRPSYVGKQVAYDCSTAGHPWFRVGTLEKYFECHGVMRSVIYVGKEQRILLDHYPGREIYELEPWSFDRVD